MADEKVPQISLENLLLISAASERAFELEAAAREKYQNFASSASIPFIKRKRAVFSRMHFLQEYEIIGSGFFRIGGEYTRIARESFSQVMQDYDPFLKEVSMLAPQAREVLGKLNGIQSEAEPLSRIASNCLNHMKKEMKNGGQTVLFPESAEMPPKTAVEKMVYGLHALVNDYNSAAASLAADLPYSGIPASSQDISDSVNTVNFLLNAGVWDFSALGCSEMLCSIYGALSKISLCMGRAAFSFEAADLLSIKWNSDKFADHFSRMGFEAVYEKRGYSGRGKRPSYCIKWIKK